MVISKVSAAHGQIVNFSYPSSAKQNTTIYIRAAVRNVGGSSGRFKLQVFEGYTRRAQSTTFTVNAGQTSPTRAVSVRTSASSATAEYTLKCVRVT